MLAGLSRRVVYTEGRGALQGEAVQLVMVIGFECCLCTAVRYPVDQGATAHVTPTVMKLDAVIFFV